MKDLTSPGRKAPFQSLLANHCRAHRVVCLHPCSDAPTRALDSDASLACSLHVPVAHFVPLSMKCKPYPSPHVIPLLLWSIRPERTSNAAQ